MKPCQYCGQPATIHLTDILNKKKTESHLCEACAAGEGIAGASLGELLTKFMTQDAEVGAKPKHVHKPRAAACPGCGGRVPRRRRG